MRVYIAGPYTKGDVAVNVRNAIEAGNMVAGCGTYTIYSALSYGVVELFTKTSLRMVL